MTCDQVHAAHLQHMHATLAVALVTGNMTNLPTKLKPEIFNILFCFQTEVQFAANQTTVLAKPSVQPSFNY